MGELLPLMGKIDSPPPPRLLCPVGLPALVQLGFLNKGGGTPEVPVGVLEGRCWPRDQQMGRNSAGDRPLGSLGPE